jgi:competence protein ComGC
VTTIRKSEGFALIDLIFVVGIIGILCGIAAPNLLQARQSSGAASAVGSLRAISSGQLTFALTCGGGFYAPALTDLGRAPVGSSEAFVSPNIGSDDVIVRAGYRLEMEALPFGGSPASCNGVAAGDAGLGFAAGADPLEPNSTRFFAVNANGQIWEHSSTLYPTIPETGDSPLGGPLKW